MNRLIRALALPAATAALFAGTLNAGAAAAAPRHDAADKPRQTAQSARERASDRVEGEVTRVALRFERYANQHDGQYPASRDGMVTLRDKTNAPFVNYLVHPDRTQMCAVVAIARDTSASWVYDSAAAGLGVYKASRVRDLAIDGACRSLLKAMIREGELRFALDDVWDALGQSEIPATVEELTAWWGQGPADYPKRGKHHHVAEYTAVPNPTFPGAFDVRLCVVDDRGGWATVSTSSGTVLSSGFGAECRYSTNDAGGRRMAIANAKQVVTAVSAYGQKNDLTGAEVLRTTTTRELGLSAAISISDVGPQTYTSYSTGEPTTVPLGVVVHARTGPGVPRSCVLDVAGALPVLIEDSCR